MSLTIENLCFDDLNQDHRRVWDEIQSRNPQLASPLFAAQLYQLCHELRGGIEVALLKHGGEIVGFFPYHRGSRQRATPALGLMADFQGAVIKPGLKWDPQQVVKAAGLHSWRFDHLLADQSGFERFHVVSANALFIDLSQGIERYFAERKRAGVRELMEAQRKERKIEREVGRLRWIPNCRDAQVFEAMISWKGAQVERLGGWNCFSEPWTVPLLRRVLEAQQAELSGVLGALFVDDELLAAHLGLQSRNVFHGWITTFNHKYSKYSPGSLLLLNLLRWAEASGIRRIDMGKGEGHYKRRLANGATRLAEGAVSGTSSQSWGHTAWLRVREVVRQSPFGHRAQRWTRRLRALTRPS